MEVTGMSDEIERERVSTRPERENPALPVPAIRRASAARPPHACDPTRSKPGTTSDWILDHYCTTTLKSKLGPELLTGPGTGPETGGL